MKRSRIRRKPHRDPVTPELHDYIVTRDAGCVGPLLDMDGSCYGKLEIDHIDNAGLGRRGPSVPSNLVTLCATHHFLKTTNARTWRPVLRQYVASQEPRVA
jgi:hypothetical protein